MSRSAAATALAAVALVTLLAPAPATAGTPAMLPLAVGNVWNFQGNSGTVSIEAITGSRLLRGRTVAVKSYLAGPDSGLVNWWVPGADGEVLLAGFDNPAAGLSLAYEPPITICSGAPAMGDLWTAAVTAYVVPAMTVYSGFQITYGLVEHGFYLVPAGEFHAYGVAQMSLPTVPSAAGDRQLMLDGRYAAGAAGASVRAPGTTTINATDWYTSGLGEIQYFTSELFRLTDYQVATPARSRSWGAVKQSYR